MHLNRFIQRGIVVLFLTYSLNASGELPLPADAQADPASQYVSFLSKLRNDGMISPDRVEQLQLAWEKRGAIENPITDTASLTQKPLHSAFAGLIHTLTDEQKQRIGTTLAQMTQAARHQQHQIDLATRSVEIPLSTVTFIELEPGRIDNPISSRPITLSTPLRVGQFPVTEGFWLKHTQTAPLHITDDGVGHWQLGSEPLRINNGSPVHAVVYKGDVINDPATLINALNAQLPNDATYVYDIPRLEELQYILLKALQGLQQRAAGLFVSDNQAPSPDQVPITDYGYFDAGNAAQRALPPKLVGQRSPLWVDNQPIFDLFGLVQMRCYQAEGQHAAFGIADQNTLAQSLQVANLLYGEKTSALAKWYFILSGHSPLGNRTAPAQALRHGLRLVMRPRRAMPLYYQIMRPLKTN